MTKEQILRGIKERLQRAYGDRLRGIVLYGSEARGEADEDSDIDLLVLLDGPVEDWEDISTTVDALYDIQLEVIRPISALPVDFKDFEAGNHVIYRNVKKEGIFL